MKHVIGCLVENHFGVLARVSGLFSARGFNIDSLAVGRTEDPTISRMTIVVDGDEKTLEQCVKQLNRLVDVIRVMDFKEDEVLSRGLVMVKVRLTPDNKEDLIQITNTFRGRIIDYSPGSLTVEATGSEGKIDALIELLKPIGLIEVVRTGRIALSRERELVYQPHDNEPSADRPSRKEAHARARKNRPTVQS